MTQSLGTFSRQFGEVVASRLGAVAAADQEEVPDGPALDRVDDLVGHT